MNRRSKFDAASFILGGEIRNRTNKQTVNDVSTPCLSECVDKMRLGGRPSAPVRTHLHPPMTV